MTANPQQQQELRDKVRDCLQQIIDPCSAANGTHFNLVEMGLIRDIEVTDDNEICVKLRLTSPGCFMLEYFSIEIRRRVGSLLGVGSVEIESDAGFDWEPGMMDQKRRGEYLAALRRVLPVVNS